jgi:hypothetical protein
LSSENEPEEDLQNLQELQDSIATSKATTSASQTHLQLHQELSSETEPEEDLQHLQESQDSSNPCRISSARHTAGTRLIIRERTKNNLIQVGARE